MALEKSKNALDVQGKFSQEMCAVDPNELLCVAVSGGSDSMSLIYLAKEWQEAGVGRSNLIGLIVDHGLRQESAAEAAQVQKRLCDSGIDAVLLAWKPERANGNLMERARIARFGLMTKWCLEHGVSKILIGHTLDDRLETFCMNALRGSGIDGLAPIKRLSDQNGISLVRPMLRCTRAELRDFLVMRGIAWVEDPTNKDERFLRARVRAQIARLDHVSRNHLVATLYNLDRVKDFVEQEACKAELDCVERVDMGLAIDWAKLRCCHEEIVLHVLRRSLNAVQQRYHPPRLKSLLLVIGRIAKAKRSITMIVAGVRVDFSPKANRALLSHRLR